MLNIKRLFPKIFALSVLLKGKGEEALMMLVFKVL